MITEYWDSILLELEQISILARNMFAQAEYHVEEGNILCIEMESSVVAEGKKRMYPKASSQDFRGTVSGCRQKYGMTFKEKEKSNEAEMEDVALQREINAIFARSTVYQEEKQAERKEEKKSETDGQKKILKDSPANGKAKEGNGKGGFQKGGFSKGGFSKGGFKRGPGSDDPNLIWGRNFDSEPISLDQVVGEMGEITFHGMVISVDTREIRNEKTILMFAVTDETDTITVKMFTQNEQLPDLLAEVKKGAFLKICGITSFDRFDGELTIGICPWN